LTLEKAIKKSLKSGSHIRYVLPVYSDCQTSIEKAEQFHHYTPEISKAQNTTLHSAAGWLKEWSAHGDISY